MIRTRPLFATLALTLLMSVALPLTVPADTFVGGSAHIRQVHHRTIQIDDLDIFYREAGRREAPTILLLHGFPTSSHMFRNLIPQLSERYHVIAPDYPGVRM